MVVALVPVRKGSERVPRKNIKSFAGTSLLEIKISQLKRIKKFNEIVVTSDCDEMLALAKNLGVSSHKRDELYCLASTPMSEVYKYFGREFKEHQTLAYVNVTNPLINDDVFDTCLRAFETKESHYTSVNTVTPIKDFMWYDGYPINYDPLNQPRSQDLPNYYSLNFACNIVSTDVLASSGMVVGAKHIPVFVDKIQALDIDDIYDFEIAETLYKKKIGKR